MTHIESIVDRAKAKVAAVEAKGLSYVPQILDAHKQVIAAEKSGHQRSLDAAIAAGELLIAAKEAIKGKFKWGEWRSEYLSELPRLRPRSTCGWPITRKSLSTQTLQPKMGGELATPLLLCRRRGS
jgi:hypothetical protein